MSGIITTLLAEGVLPLVEYSQEPRRAKLDLDSIGLAADAGVKNIMAVYNQATEAEKDYWGRWYHYAKSDVEELATEVGLPFKLTAAVVATLSPGNKWYANLNVARKLIAGETRLSAYPMNVVKARRILDEQNPELVSGPKVRVFYESLLDPVAFERELVLDGHAINIWRGRKVSLKDTENVGRQDLRRQILRDYQEAANQLGTTTQAVQATTWLIWKYGSHTARS